MKKLLEYQKSRELARDRGCTFGTPWKMENDRWISTLTGLNKEVEVVKLDKKQCIEEIKFFKLLDKMAPPVGAEK